MVKKSPANAGDMGSGKIPHASELLSPRVTTIVPEM